VHVIENSRVNGTRTYGDPDAGGIVCKDYAVHVVAFLGNLALPQDVLRVSQDVTIQRIGLDKPQSRLELSLQIY
jgi:hypothetical protein